MTTIRTKLKKVVDSSYDILIEDNILSEISSHLKEFKNSKICILTDSNVYPLYGEKLADDLEEASSEVVLYQFQAGEDSKSREEKAKIEDFLIKKQFNRDSLLIALGGGVVGDLGGFVSSTFMRGIPFIQIPTSLLAMVDSSVGGKTAISTKNAKNIIGTFYQPIQVLIDPTVLKTLPEEEFLGGISEIIKMALILDKKLFAYLEENREKILKRDPKSVQHLIEESIKLKAEIVSKDEKEQGLRQILNYGHTIGHAIETALSHKLSHGFCISIGMSYADEIACNLGLLAKEDKKRHLTLLKSYKLPTELTKNIDLNKLLEIIKLDKKNKEGKFNFVLLAKTGKFKKSAKSYTVLVSENEIKKVFN